MDGDFDYQIFWNNIVDFFEDAPGPAARARVNELLEWWTRQVTDHQQRLILTANSLQKSFRAKSSAGLDDGGYFPNVRQCARCSETAYGGRRI